jgi:nucleoside-diphosphate-sugar epimerase
MGMMNLQRRRILVTGATGFIGSHLARRLVQEEADVHVLVRSPNNLWRLQDIHNKLTFHTVDIKVQELVENVCKEVNPEIVYHLASYGVDYRQQDLEEAVTTNILGTSYLLRALNGTACERFIYTGSCLEYGDKDGPIREDTLLEPTGIYGAGKAASTIIIRTLAISQKIPLLIFRPFGVYGPFEGKHKFIPYLILSLLKGEKPNLTSCRQVRDYTYIEDIVDALLKANTPLTNTPLIINLGTGIPITLKRIVEIILEFFSEGEVHFGAIPNRENETGSLWADVKKAKELFGWEAKTSLKEGLKKTVEWFKSHQHLYSED